MKYILSGSKRCYQIYLSQHVFCATPARMVGSKNGIFNGNTHKQRGYRRVFTSHTPPMKPCNQLNQQSRVGWRKSDRKIFW